MTKGLFNGHTWIIVLVCVIGLIGLGAYSEYEIFSLLKLEKVDDTAGVGALAAIPYTVIKGVEMIVKRLTYIPNVDTAETLKEDK